MALYYKTCYRVTATPKQGSGEYKVTRAWPDKERAEAFAKGFKRDQFTVSIVKQTNQKVGS